MGTTTTTSQLQLDLEHARRDQRETLASLRVARLETFDLIQDVAQLTEALTELLDTLDELDAFSAGSAAARAKVLLNRINSTGGPS